MLPRLITMLTYRDQTVPNALNIFEQCKNLPVQYWGFKDIGLSSEEMRDLVKAMKAAGKVTFLEVVTYTEEECLRAARLAVEYKFDYLMGTVFYPSVFELVKKSTLKYMPFCGKVSGNPSILEGTIEEIIVEAKKLQQLGVDGFDLLAYRYQGDCEKLAQNFLKEITIPVVLAGSIDSFAKLDLIKALKPWGFTIGGAFFDRKFLPGGTYKQQIEKVIAYLNE